jgi:hypothetical protein
MRTGEAGGGCDGGLPRSDDMPALCRSYESSLKMNCCGGSASTVVMILGELPGEIPMLRGSSWETSMQEAAVMLGVSCGDADASPPVGMCRCGWFLCRRRSFVTRRKIMEAKMKGPPPHRYHSGLTWRSVIPKMLYVLISSRHSCRVSARVREGGIQQQR